MTTTIDDLEEKQLENLLISGGFLAAFTDILGNSQPAPSTQIFELNTTDLDPNERAVMIRRTGGVSNPATRFNHKIVPMVVVVCGKANQEDRIVSYGLAQDMEKYLVKNYVDTGCLFDITSSGVNGPFTLADSRRLYEINIMVSFNI